MSKSGLLASEVISVGVAIRERPGVIEMADVADAQDAAPSCRAAEDAEEEEEEEEEERSLIVGCGGGGGGGGEKFNRRMRR
jgi:ribosomal protein L12E/L44/L45/RPP1/RPP2